MEESSQMGLRDLPVSRRPTAEGNPPWRRPSTIQAWRARTGRHNRTSGRHGQTSRTDELGFGLGMLAGKRTPGRKPGTVKVST